MERYRIEVAPNTETIEVLELLKNLKELYPNAHFYLIGVHDTGGIHNGSRKLSRQRFNGLAIHSSVHHNGILIKGNPWKGRDYQGIPYGESRNSKRIDFVSQEEMVQHRIQAPAGDYVWVGYDDGEFEAIEVELNAESNKEASKLLTKLEEE